MKYTKEERLDIGRRTYNNEFTKREAMAKFGISEGAVDMCIRLYRTENNPPPRGNTNNPLKSRAVLPQEKTKYAEFESMTREELIGEIIKARINEERAKKAPPNKSLEEPDSDSDSCCRTVPVPICISDLHVRFREIHAG